MGRHTKDIRKCTFSDFYCTQCSVKGIPILRQPGKEKEPGHLKKLFCLNCNDLRNMVEIKPNGKYTLDDFLAEYEGGNFDTEGNRKESWKTFIYKEGEKEE